MNVEQMTARINALYHKSQAEGLTAEEKEEQKQLRSAYVANVRANLRGQLNQISIVEKDGSITDLGKKHGQNYFFIHFQLWRTPYLRLMRKYSAH